jgi:hypothetical protein
LQPLFLADIVIRAQIAIHRQRGSRLFCHKKPRVTCGGKLASGLSFPQLR